MTHLPENNEQLENLLSELYGLSAPRRGLFQNRVIFLSRRPGTRKYGLKYHAVFRVWIRKYRHRT